MNELNESDALRADIYRLLARLLREAPDDELLGWLSGLEIDIDGTLLAERWAALSAAARETTAEDEARAHFRHLVGVVQGDVTPYASWYRNGELMDVALVDLRRDLKALGFQRAEHSQDPEDHLAALAEVMAMLIEARSPDEAQFFMAHVAPWAANCLADLGRVDTPFHACLGRLGQVFIEQEGRRLEAEAQQQPVRIVEP